MRYLLLLAFVYASYRFARFVLEPDYIPGFVARNRCDTGEAESRDAFAAVEQKIDAFLRNL